MHGMLKYHIATTFFACMTVFIVLLAPGVVAAVVAASLVAAIVMWDAARRVWILVWLGLQSWRDRLSGALLIAAGAAAVTLFALAVNVLQSSLLDVFAPAGDEQTMIIMRSSAQSEADSFISPDTVALIATLRGIERDGRGHAALSAEMAPSIDARFQNGKPVSGVQIRGIDLSVTNSVRPALKILRGRAPSAGLREVMVGEKLERLAQQDLINQSVILGADTWKITGVFQTHGVDDSVFLADVNQVRQAFGDMPIQSVWLRLAPDKQADFLEAMRADTRLAALDAKSTGAYYASQMAAFQTLFRVVGYPLVAALALGALLASLNATYTAVGSRRAEMLVLRAIGFSPWSITLSVMLEIGVLSLVGALTVLGAATWLAHGQTISTVSGNRSVLAIDLKLDPATAMMTLRWAIAVGCMAALLPIRSVQRTALRGDLMAHG